LVFASFCKGTFQPISYSTSPISSQLSIM
jgi:hypothetical protein